MIEKLRTYPRIFYLLCLYLLIQQAIYAQLSPWAFLDFGNYDKWYPNSDNFIWMPVLTGIAAILAGFIADQLRDVKRGLFISLGALLAAGAVGIIRMDTAFFLSHFLVEMASNLFFFLIVLHIAVLFPVANDWKDNAFVLLQFGILLGATILGIILVASSVIGIDNFLVSAITSFGLTVLLIFLIYFEDDIGYDISGDADESPGFLDAKWPVLVGGVALLSVFSLAENGITLIGTPKHTILSINSALNWTLPLLKILLIVGTVFFLLLSTHSSPANLQFILLVPHPVASVGSPLGVRGGNQVVHHVLVRFIRLVFHVLVGLVKRQGFKDERFVFPKKN